MGRRKKLQPEVITVNEKSNNEQNNDSSTKTSSKKNKVKTIDLTEDSSTKQLKISSMIRHPQNCNASLNLLEEASLERTENKNADNIQKLNAFQFLMDIRNKSLGQNIDGKTLSISETAPVEISDETKAKLLRKEKFNDWATKKVGAKRKLQEEEEEARDLFISETMVKRSRRLKTMLKINVVDDDSSDLDYEPKKNVKKRGKEKEKLTLESNKFDKENAKSFKNKQTISNDDRSKNCDPVRLAPIFSLPKKIDSEVLAARRSFLYSDMPSSVRKKLEHKNSIENQKTPPAFPSISHIQQKNDNKMWFLPPQRLPLTMNTVHISYLNYNNLGQGLIDPAKNESSVAIKEFNNIKNITSYINKIKMENPTYPVFKAFTSLSLISGYPQLQGKKKRKISNNKKISTKQNNIMWTEKYRPKSSKDFIGNLAPVLKLQKWLLAWADNSAKSSNYNSESEFESDNETTANCPSNAVILVGPHGSGKTASVYAIAEELGYNILELNTSTKRTGKKLVQELQEATQSHQLHKQNSMLSYSKKQNEKSNCNEQKLCLFLVDDIDIIFEQDEGFIMALSQLLQTSKRPIILTTSNLDCCHLQRFNHYPILNFRKLSANSQAIWLQIMCAMEGLQVNLKCIIELLEWNNGDLRKTMLHLQFWLKSGGNHISFNCPKETNIVFNNIEIDDDLEFTCNLKDRKRNEIKQEKLHGQCMKAFFPIRNLIPHTTDLENYWEHMRKSIFESSQSDKVEERDFNLQNYVNLLDALCLSDLMQKKCYLSNNFTQIHGNKLTDSLNLTECLEYYEDSFSFNEDFRNYLLENTCRNCTDKQIPWYMKSYHITSPSYEGPIANSLSITISMDYESFQLDYCSAIRSIARSEEMRSKNNWKRSNRFYNYLNNLGIKCSTSVLQTLCKSLNIGDNTDP